MNLNEETLSTWLGSIYTMETDVNQIISSQIETVPETDDLKKNLQKYVDNFQKRNENLENLLKTLKSDTSTIKTAVSKFLGTVKAKVDGLRSNENLHSLASDLGLLQHAIAYYRVAQLMSEKLEKKELTQNIEENMKQHLELAEMINQSFTKIVNDLFTQKNESKKEA